VAASGQSRRRGRFATIAFKQRPSGGSLHRHQDPGVVRGHAEKRLQGVQSPRAWGACDPKARRCLHQTAEIAKRGGLVLSSGRPCHRRPGSPRWSAREQGAHYRRRRTQAAAEHRLDETGPCVPQGGPDHLQGRPHRRTSDAVGVGRFQPKTVVIGLAQGLVCPCQRSL
jgi:hypothetical protein